MINIYQALGESTSPKWCSAFAQGCSTIGLKSLLLTDRHDYHAGDVAMFGSPKLWKHLMAYQTLGRNWFYGDHGTWSRGTQYKVTLNDLQPQGIDLLATHHRLQRVGCRVRDFRKNGTHILLCVPSIAFGEYRGFSTEDWVRDTMREIQKHTDRPVVMRWKTEAKEKPLAEALLDCWCVVSYNSNVAIEAAAAGIPSLSFEPRASAQAMGWGWIENIEKLEDHPHRAQWLYTMANNQWTLQEMASGKVHAELIERHGVCIS